MRGNTPDREPKQSTKDHLPHGRGRRAARDGMFCVSLVDCFGSLSSLCRTLKHYSFIPSSGYIVLFFLNGITGNHTGRYMIGNMTMI